jgi:hypothetical protein
MPKEKKNSAKQTNAANFFLTTKSIRKQNSHNESNKDSDSYYEVAFIVDLKTMSA